MTPRGLTAAEAARRLREAGPNELRERPPTPAWVAFARQFASPLVLLLAVACGVAGLLGEVADAVAIGVIVVINGIVGFVQEYRAERAVRALRALTAPRARVERDGRVVEVPAREVVTGDVLVLEAGDLVAADARLFEAHALETMEAALTGESAPVAKSTEPVADGAALADRSDQVFAGTSVSRGSGAASVTSTGMATEIGKIAALLEATEEEGTPLQQRLELLSRTLLVLCTGLVVLVGALGLAQGRPWLEVAVGAVSLAVAAVPEGLPAVVTIALAVGVQRMAARNVLVRRLPAVEALGSTSVICTDKTGTLTTGRMEVRERWLAPGVTEEELYYASAACSDADLDGGSGDPTELALLGAARAAGIERTAIERTNARVTVHPFDAGAMRMSILRADGRLYVKGAPDRVIPLTDGGRDDAFDANRRLAERGLRVLAVAVAEGDREEGARLLGLVGIADPPRPEAIEAVRRARAAGIRTVMITGDHPLTAGAIAREMGILLEGEEERHVHARVTPEDKLKIVRAWKERGAVVAMTGDGVNDAPALREAHVGVAMGRTGTEVTREAADMVLADDNFASIVAAVQEGRSIFDNIRKSLVYLLTGNTGELAVMLGAAIAGLPAPLLPLQLLWINLVTDGFPALALVLDPPSPDALDRPPRPLSEPMLGAPQWKFILGVGLLEAGLGFGVFATHLPEGVATARTLAFYTVVASQLLRSFGSRSVTRTLWEVGPWTNVKLVAVVVVSLAAQLALLAVPGVRDLFGLVAVGGRDLLLALGLGLVPVSTLETVKIVRASVRARRVP